MIDHYDGRFFSNPWMKSNHNFLDVIKWQWTRHPAKWPLWLDDNKKPTLIQPTKQKSLTITFVNQASFYIQTQNLSLLTDPVFSMRTSPVTFAGPKRVRPPGLQISEIPKLDIVLISHNHYDHMDKESIQQLSARFNPLFIVPLKNKELVQSFGAKRVIELDWWQESQELPLIKVTLVPSQHWSSRGFFDRNTALWGGFVIEADGLNVFFAGDTGYGPHFSWIQKKWPGMDLSILPIGAYEPRWFMGAYHMNPQDAVKAHKDLNARRSIGCHFGTFQLTDEAIDAPLKDLEKAKAIYQIQDEHFQTLMNGESLQI